MRVEAGIRARLSHVLALCCGPPQAHLEPPQVYLGFQGGPKEKQMEVLWLLGKLSSPHWLCPLHGPAPGSIPRAQSQGCGGKEPRGATLPFSPLCGHQEKG